MSGRDQTRDTTDGILQQSCLLCRLPDSDAMVRCDDCEQWFHLECVEINADVVSHDWSCRECVNARVPAPQSSHQQTPTGEPLQHQQSSIPPQSTPRLPTPRTSFLPVFSPRSQTPIILPRSPLPNHQPPTPRPRTPQSPNPLPPTPRQRTPPIPTVQPGVSPVSSQILVDPDLVNKLPADLRIRLLKEEEAIERKFLLRRFQLLLQSSGTDNPADQGNDNRSGPAHNHVRDAPVPQSSTMNDHRRVIPPFAPPMPHQVRNDSTFIPRLREKQLYVPVDIKHLANSHPYFSAPEPFRVNQQANNPPPADHRPNASTFVPPWTDQHPYFPSFSQPNRCQLPKASPFAPYIGLPRPTAQQHYPYGPRDFSSAVGGTALLSRSQIAARQAVSKELPIFSGDPDEWPLFFATYENTTKLCGFSPEENLVRLQKCLRGKALEAVKSQLLHPSNLTQVLSTLRMLFGRPEIIVHSLLLKINALPAPKADRLDTLVEFALAVRNMVATVKACELEEHLCNLTLMYNLVERLPPMVRLNWAIHRQSLISVTLSDFSDWLYKLAEAASTVTMPQFMGSVDSEIRREQTNAHNESDSEFEQSNAENECIICQGNCEVVEECEQFVSMDVSTRWAVLRKHKLCRCCLEAHRGPCRFGKSCGMNGCEFKHHRLMHNDTKDKPVTSSSKYHAQTPQHSVANSSHETNSCNTHRGGRKGVLFQYVPVMLRYNGKKVRTYAFLDSGSSLTLMEESLAKQLCLRGEKHPLCLRWTADTCRYEEGAMRVSLNVSGTYDGCSQSNLTDVYTVKELKLPSQSISTRNLSEKYSHLDGLPMESYSNVQPKLLIGLNNVRVIHALDSREGNPNEPVAVKTRLGWTIYGSCSSEDGPPSNTMPFSYHICFHSYEPDEILPETDQNKVLSGCLGICASQNQNFSKEDEVALAKQNNATTLQNRRYSGDVLRFSALKCEHCLFRMTKRELQPPLTMRAKITVGSHNRRSDLALADCSSVQPERTRQDLYRHYRYIGLGQAGRKANDQGSERRYKRKWVGHESNHWGGLLRTPVMRRRTYSFISWKQRRCTVYQERTEAGYGKQRLGGAVNPFVDRGRNVKKKNKRRTKAKYEN